jgi:carboxylate-amine ligase
VKEATDIFGTHEYVNRIRTIAKHGTSAHRQIEVFEKTNDLKKVVDWLVAETMREI